MSANEHYVVQHYSILDGMSQNTVMAILQDKQGFMWFGTWDGLNRFDGYTFEVFKAMSHGEAAHVNNRVDWIYEDEQEQIWWSTYDGHYYCLDATRKVTTEHPYDSLCGVYLEGASLIPCHFKIPGSVQPYDSFLGEAPWLESQRRPVFEAYGGLVWQGDGTCGCLFPTVDPGIVKHKAGGGQYGDGCCRPGQAGDSAPSRGSVKPCPLPEAFQGFIRVKSVWTVVFKDKLQQSVAILFHIGHAFHDTAQRSAVSILKTEQMEKSTTRDAGKTT